MAEEKRVIQRVGRDYIEKVGGHATLITGASGQAQQQVNARELADKLSEIQRGRLSIRNEDMPQQKIIVAALIVQHGKILLAQRAAAKRIAPGKYHLPGGQVEFGEEATTKGPVRWMPARSIRSPA